MLINRLKVEPSCLKDVLIITAIKLASIIHPFQTNLCKLFYESKFLTPISILLFLVCITSEYFYFDASVHYQQKNMLTFYRQQEPLNSETTREIFNFIKENMSKDSVILTDNAFFYPATALTRSDVNFLDQFENTFFDAIQSPKQYTDYILMTNPNRDIHKRDKMNVVLEKNKNMLQ